MSDITVQNNIKSVLGPGLDKLGATEEAQKTEDGKSFSDTLAESIAKVSELQKDADKAIGDLVTGKSQNIHETMLAVNKADLAFRMTMQVRNKIVEAYQEVMRMQV
jgi:flagellar hook-basal body complex protein FliE